MKIVFHGTNKENALKIIKHGFKTGTHFAEHLEDSLEFGGSWVFMVKFENPPKNWQFVTDESLPPSRIYRLTQYQPIVRIGIQPHFTRKLDNKQESKNLTGVPL